MGGRRPWKELELHDKYGKCWVGQPRCNQVVEVSDLDDVNFEKLQKAPLFVSLPMKSVSTLPRLGAIYMERVKTPRPLSRASSTKGATLLPRQLQSSANAARKLMQKCVAISPVPSRTGL